MFCLLAKQIASQFIPYTSTSGIFYDVYTDKKFNAEKRKNNYFIVAFLNDTDDSFRPCINMFSKLPTIYSEDVTFAVVMPTTAPKTYENLDVTENSILFYRNGLLSFSVPFPLTEFELSSTIDFFIKPAQTPVNSTEELFRSLPDVDFTILSPPSLAQQARGYISVFSEGYGSIAILPVETSVLKKLNFTGDKLCLYRRTDKIIKEFEDNFEGFREAAHAAFYPTFDCEMFEMIDGYVGLLVVDNSATQEQKNLLTELGNEFKEVFFGIIDKEETEPLDKLTSYQIGGNNSFVLFNYSDRIYYPIQELNKSTSKFISEVLKGNVKAHYPSEEIPEKQNDPFITKVVGKNYKEFVEAPGPVFMFYLNDRLEGLRVAHKLGKYYSRNNLSTRVGYILYSDNACELPFPRITFSPTIAYFPEKNKSAFYKHYCSNTVYGLLETQSLDTNENLNQTLFDYERELQFLVNLVPELDGLEEIDNAMFKAFILARGYQMGLGHSVPEIIDNVLSRSGGIVSGFKDLPEPEWEEIKEEEFVNADGNEINNDEYVIYEVQPRRHHHSHHRRHHHNH